MSYSDDYEPTPVTAHIVVQDDTALLQTIDPRTADTVRSSKHKVTTAAFRRECTCDPFTPECTCRNEGPCAGAAGGYNTVTRS